MTLDEKVLRWQQSREDHLVEEVLEELAPLMRWTVRRYRIDDLEEGMAAARLGVLLAMRSWEGKGSFAPFAVLAMRSELWRLSRQTRPFAEMPTEIPVEMRYQIEESRESPTQRLLRLYGHRLSPLERLIIQERLLRQKTYQEIGRRIGRKPSWVAWKLQRTLEKVRDMELEARRCNEMAETILEYSL